MIAQFVSAAEPADGLETLLTLSAVDVHLAKLRTQLTGVKEEMYGVARWRVAAAIDALTEAKKQIGKAANDLNES
jgi:hypothetical protein